MRYVYVATTVLLTVYGQLILKWRVEQSDPLPDGVGDRIVALVRLAFEPWMLTVFVAAFVAALSWMAAMTQLDLSRAYPFVAFSFILVLIGSAVFFDEALTAPKVLGVLLIMIGLAVGAQG